MTEHRQIPNLAGVLPLIDDSYEQILSSIQTDYHLEEGPARRLYQHLWIYTHGIAALCATNMCRFTEEEISGMMTEVCRSLLTTMKAGNDHD